ncbi:MAG: hypothetical protein WB783_04500 [Arenicellales bacterium]
MPFTIDTKDIDAVRQECERVYHSMYRDADAEFLGWACGWFEHIFSGHYKDFLPIDVPYHDREHTMQGLLCLVRLLNGRHKAGAKPRLSRRSFELTILAILLHDTGYLKHRTDTAGTGAKYTLIHVTRSREFAEAFLGEQGYACDEIDAVRNMIQCTSVDVSPADITFANPIERVGGLAIATADLMGQMSADDYVDRLPQLYAEFEESYDYFGEKAERLHYAGPGQLISQTPEFWRNYVRPKLVDECEGLYRFLADPYPDGDNAYLKRIEANVALAARVATN